MSNLKLFLVTLLLLTMSLIEVASAQVVVRRGPRYNPNPDRYPDYRPAPDYRPRRPMPDRRRPRPDYQTRGRVSCSASDRGWEEHWGGHGSCGSCLQHHGNCVEQCHEVRQVCEVQGADYQGVSRTYTGRGVDRWAAERDALRKCEWDREMRSCNITSCREDRQLVSSRSCR